MSKDPRNLYPTLDRILGRRDKEEFLIQRSKVIWFTGLSGAGKTTLAIGVEQRLHNFGYFTQILDGDNVRKGICGNLGFSEADRQENIRRIAEVSKLFLDCGVITINCFISPTEEIRQVARNIIGEHDLIEVFVNAPIEVCEQRDTKGLYKKARSGQVKNFTGIDSPFDAPENPDIEVRTDLLSVEEAVEEIFEFILPLVEYN